MARLTGPQRRKERLEREPAPKPEKGDTKKVKIKGRTITRYYDGKKWVNNYVAKEIPLAPKLTKVEQKSEELKIRNKDNEALLAKNRAALTTQGVSRNWDNPVGDELWLQDTMEPETGGWNEREGGEPTNTAIRNLQATNKYQAEKEEQELYSGWHKSQQADRMESKGLTIEPIQEQKGKNKTTPKSTGTSLEKKFEKIYGKRKMKRFNQVYGKLNLSDRMRRHLLMSKAFRDM